MALGIFKEIEKLITEHGSATILKERIEQIKEQYAELDKENGGLKTENAELKLKCKELEDEILQHKELTEKFGVYWKNGTPYCPKCKTPTTTTQWAIYNNIQARALNCSCSDLPIILMNKGELIHADEAMKEMAKQSE